MLSEHRRRDAVPSVVADYDAKATTAAIIPSAIAIVTPYVWRSAATFAFSISSKISALLLLSACLKPSLSV